MHVCFRFSIISFFGLHNDRLRSLAVKLPSTNPYQINAITKEYIFERRATVMCICISKYINIMYIMPFLLGFFCFSLRLCWMCHYLLCSPMCMCVCFFCSVWTRPPHVLMYDFHWPCCLLLIVGGPLTQHFHLFTFLSWCRAIYAKIVHTVFLFVHFVI